MVPASFGERDDVIPTIATKRGSINAISRHSNAWYLKTGAILPFAFRDGEINAPLFRATNDPQLASQN